MSSVRTGTSKMSKRDRDLQVLVAMQPVAAEHRALKRDIEEHTFALMVTRMIWGFNMMMALLLFVVAAVIWSIACCGSHDSYDKEQFNESCRTEAEKWNDTEWGQWSCYHRNITIISVASFGLFLLIVGATIMISGQCCYGVERKEGNAEAELEDIAAEVKANAIEQRIAEREEARILREERAAWRAAHQVDRREQTRAAREEQAERLRAVPYGGARRYSIGTPSTMVAPRQQVVQRQVFYPQPRQQVVHSYQPQQYVVQQPHTAYQPTRIRISSGDSTPNTYGRRVSNGVEIRTTRYVV